MKKNIYNFIIFLKEKLFSKKVIAFSLVELMISLITISCICAAFAPVITKKLNKSAVAIKSGNQLISDCTKFKYSGDETNYCKTCYPDECIVCTRTCRSDQYLNLKQCRCDSCGANCVSCSAAGAGKCDRCAAGYYKDGTACKSCPANNCCPEGTTKTSDNKYPCSSHYGSQSLLNN